MAISQRDVKILWGRAAGRCSAPDCHEDLMPYLARSRRVILGEMAHVIGRQKGAARSKEQVGVDDDYNNLVLLCPTHHTLVDSAAADFPVELLRKWKTDWETTVQNSLLRRASSESGFAMEMRLWSYFNFDVILQLCEQSGIETCAPEVAGKLLSEGIINTDGFPTEGTQPCLRRSIFETWPQDKARSLQRYFTSLVEQILREQPPLDILEAWGVRKLRQLLFPGAVGFANRGFSFKAVSSDGQRERRRVRCQARRVELVFEIDTWNAYADSSITLHFCGTSSVAALLLIRSVESATENPKASLVVKETPIALGTGFWPSPATDRTPSIALEDRKTGLDEGEKST